MKWIKNLAVFSLLIFAFLFSTSEAKTPCQSFEKTAKQSNSIESIDYFKVAAFVKPYNGTHISSDNRDHFPLYAKWFASYIEFQFSHFHIFSEYASFIKQDINRCYSVSVLIFPFHLFW